MVEFLFLLVKVLLTVVVLLLMVAFLSLFERKFLGYSQSRKGPNVVGVGGNFQPFADALKLISKIDTSPEKSSSIGFFFPPILFFFSSLSVWVVIPNSFNPFSFQNSGLFLILWLSLSVYGLIFAGWYSFSKYSTLGLCRAIVQSISYEIVLTFCMFGVFLMLGSVNLWTLLMTSKSIFFPGFFSIMGVLLYISFLAESNRIPFDLPESESELVGGYSVEYGSVSYTILFLGENLSLLLAAILMVLFFGGSELSLIKFCFFLVSFIWVRSTLPRIRFDKIMNLCWLEMIPILLSSIIFLSSLS